MKLLHLILIALLMLNAGIVYSSEKLPAQKPKANCRLALSKIIGLVPETSPANTLVLSYQGGVYIKTQMEILDSINKNTNVILVLTDRIDNLKILDTLKKRPNLKIVDFGFTPHGNVWARDWVPQKVIRKDGSVEFVNLKYDSKYSSHEAATRFTKALNLPHYESWIEGEMGNILVDGNKRLFTTTKILWDNLEDLDNKSGIRRIVSELKKAFEVKEVHFLPQHPADGGVGHIDLIAKYVGKIKGEETVIVSDSITQKTKNALDKTANIFKDLGFNVIRIEEYENGIGGSAAGFVNSLLLNNEIYMPIYSKGVDVNSKRLIELEQNARKTYEDLGFKVIEIDSSSPIKGGGAVHCLTCTLDLEK